MSPLRSVSSILLATAVLAAAVPAASDPIAARNRAWVLDHLGPEVDLDAWYTGTVGSEAVTWRGAQIVDAAVERMGHVDIAAWTSTEAISPGGDFGDIWLIGFGPGTCGPNLALAPQPFFIPLDTALWIYSGWVGLGSEEGFSGVSVGWTTKTSSTFGPEPLTYGVVTDFFCFDGVIFFPFLDGTWWQ